MHQLYKTLWAKTNKNDDWHPLLFHMVDAGNVALTLWQHYLPSSTRDRFSRLLRMDSDQAGRLLAFWASLHDMGKASPAFQAKSWKRKKDLTARGIPFPDNLSPKPHGLITTWALFSLLPSHLRPVGRVLSGHHGNLSNGNEIMDAGRFDQLGRERLWEDMRSQIFEELQRVFSPPSIDSLPDNPVEQNSLLLLLLGLVVASDWVASDDSRFGFTPPDIELVEYVKKSKDTAWLTVQELGFTGWQADGQFGTFPTLFDHRKISKPNAIQQKVMDVTSEVLPPSLVILEAPTGTGKTEAALYLADRWLQTSKGRGIYIAMPTTATSNQMFSRTREFLKHRYPESLVNLQLVHGQAFLDDAYLALQLAQIGEDDEGHVAALKWFTASKKALLAPFGVGTVDQTFLSVLQSRFFFLRLFGLEGKIIIFDEVHAYDTYMSELFFRLLGWLRAVGTSVIILSATLPDSSRRRLVSAYSGDNNEKPVGDIPPYPRLTIQTAAGTSVHTLPIPTKISRQVRLYWIGKAEEDIVQYLSAELSDGGCGAIICNTVARAQQVYLAVKAAAIVPDDECVLFHSRFPYIWRNNIEERVLARFSRDGPRPVKSIVVATQVIEQSLDLDFDLIITDLAPVDLLIQRAGRLHRHAGRQRPASLTTPTMALTRPDETREGIPDFGPDRFVYESYILDRTFILLRDRSVLALPEDTSELIEGLYGESPLPEASSEENDRLSIEKRKLQTEAANETNNAKNRLILPPEDDTFFFDGTVGLAEEDAEVRNSFKALTRSEAPGLKIICLHQGQDGRLYSDPEDGESWIDPESQLDDKKIKQLLGCAVQINRKDVMNWFLSQPAPELWQKIAALRHTHMAIFMGGELLLAGTPLVLRLDRELGLLIRKEDQ
ncbi:MAG: CRISPR-associated helicase Cas3' [Bellilinea sp.]